MNLVTDLRPVAGSDAFFFFFQAEDGIRDKLVTGVQTCALPISPPPLPGAGPPRGPAPPGSSGSTARGARPAAPVGPRPALLGTRRTRRCNAPAGRPAAPARSARAPSRPAGRRPRSALAHVARTPRRRRG